MKIELDVDHPLALAIRETSDVAPSDRMFMTVESFDGHFECTYRKRLEVLSWSVLRTGRHSHSRDSTLEVELIDHVAELKWIEEQLR